MAERKKKLLVLGSVPPPIGGATIYFQTLLQTRVAEEFDVTFLDLKFAKSIKEYGSFSLRKIGRLAGYAFGLALLLARTRFDLAYSMIQFNRGAFVKDIVFAAICRVFRVRVVGCIVGIGVEPLYREAGWFMKRFIRWGTSLFCAFITPSSEMYRRYFPEELMPFSKSNCVPFGIFTDAGEVVRPRIPDGAPVQVIYYSHYIKSKGFDEVIEAIPQVEKEHPNTTFVFAGAWDSHEHEETITRMINANGIAERAKFLGLIFGEDKSRRLRESNIFVLPTYFEFEGLPLSILEAMSYGCALVVTDHAAIASVVKDGVNGLICEPRNSNDVAAKIIALLNDREHLYQIQQNNLIKFQEHTAERFGERLAATLGALCDQSENCGVAFADEAGPSPRTNQVEKASGASR